MAGFGITFDGSLNTRRDLAEITVPTNSMELSGSLSSAAWGDASLLNMGSLNTSAQLPDTFVEGGHNVGLSSDPNFFGAGSIRYFVGGNVYSLVTPNLTGTFTWSITNNANVASSSEMLVRAYPGADRSINTAAHSQNLLFSATGTSFVLQTGVVTLSNEYLRFYNTAYANTGVLQLGILNVNIQGQIPASLTPSTTTAGVAPTTPGITVITTPSTVQDGANTPLGPKSRIAIEVANGAQTAGKVVSDPPAETLEESVIETRSTKMVVATDTTLVTSVEGLLPSNILEAVETNLQVINHKEAQGN